MDTGETPATAVEKWIRRARIQIMNSRRMTVGPEWDLDLCSPFWRLYANHRSGAFVTHNGRRSELEAGSLWLIPAWVSFRTGSARSVTQDFLHFQMSGLPFSSVQRMFSAPIRCPGGDALRFVCERWQAGFPAAGDVAHFCWAGALAHAALAGIFSEWPMEPQNADMAWLDESSNLQCALAEIDARLADPPDNRELARVCGLSEDHFIRRFRRAVGMTPAEYGREHRIFVAAEWLTDTNRTVEDIAAAAGFTDRFHFSRVFRTRLGLPPAAYRRMHRREG